MARLSRLVDKDLLEERIGEVIEEVMGDDRTLDYIDRDYGVIKAIVDEVYRFLGEMDTEDIDLYPGAALEEDQEEGQP